MNVKVYEALEGSEIKPRKCLNWFQVNRFCARDLSLLLFLRRLHHLWIWSRWVTLAALKFRPQLRLLLFFYPQTFSLWMLPLTAVFVNFFCRPKEEEEKRTFKEKREMKSLMNQSFNWPEVENGPALEFLDVWRINLTEINLKTFSFAFWEAVAFTTIFTIWGNFSFHFQRLLALCGQFAGIMLLAYLTGEPSQGEKPNKWRRELFFSRQFGVLYLNLFNVPFQGKLGVVDEKGTENIEKKIIEKINALIKSLDSRWTTGWFCSKENFCLDAKIQNRYENAIVP